VFNKQAVFNSKTKDLIDNLMHNTLEEIASHVRTIDLPSPTTNLEVELFFKDNTTKDLAI
jgi:hypothetical protein